MVMIDEVDALKVVKQVLQDWGFFGVDEYSLHAGHPGLCQCTQLLLIIFIFYLISKLARRISHAHIY